MLGQQSEMVITFQFKIYWISKWNIAPVMKNMMTIL